MQEKTESRTSKSTDTDELREPVKQELLDEIIRRVVEVADPDKIILFGSAARGRMGPNGDLDLLVVKAGIHRRQLTQAIYMNLFGVGQAVDVVVVTPEDIERYRDSFALVGSLRTTRENG
jgi:predicted nucleotidyltransferase